MQTHWTQHGSLRLEFRRHEGDPARLPLIYVPGITRGAEHLESVLPPPWDRTVLALSRRGCGQSDAPEEGYRFEDLLGDVEALIRASGLEHCALLAWSFGVRQAVHYAAHHPKEVRALVLLDGRIDDFRKSAAFVQAAAREHPGQRVLLERVARDSRDLPLEHLLEQVRCPVLLIRGGQPGGLPLEAAERYRTRLPDAQLVSFEDSGHQVWEPDRARFRGVLERFLTEQDGR